MHTTKWKHVDTIAGLWLAIMVVSSLVLPPSAQAQEKGTITWGIVDLPPSHFVTGPDAGAGPADQLIQLMQDRLAQYGHPIAVFPNFARSTKSIAQGTRVCASLYRHWPMGHPARDRRAYSMPTILFFANHLVIRQRDRHLFGETVSFEDLLHNQDLIFGHPAGRRLSPPIRHCIECLSGRRDSPDVLAKGTAELV